MPGGKRGAGCAGLVDRARRWQARRVLILADGDPVDSIPAAEEEVAALTEAWRSLGLFVERVDWQSGPASALLHRARAVLPLLAWTYSETPAHTANFCELLRSLADGGAGPRLDLRATAWHAHKKYLLEMAARGLGTVPTALLAKGAAGAELRSAVRRLDAGRSAGEEGRRSYVFKPAVGSGGDGVDLYTLGEEGGEAAVLSRAREGDLLLQPFLGGVRRHGELCFVFVNGSLLHAVRKEPAGWSARGAQRVSRVDSPPAEALATALRAMGEARAACAARPGEQIYLARVDLLPDTAGGGGGEAAGEAAGGATGQPRWLVSELELGWPHLFLRAAEGGAAAATKAVAAGLLRHLERREADAAGDSRGSALALMTLHTSM